MSIRRHAWLVTMVLAGACGTEDGDDATTVASAGTGDTGTDPSASTSPTTSATTSATTNSSTTTPADTSDSDADSEDDGPLETGPVDSGEDTTPADTGDDTGTEDDTGPSPTDGPSDDDGGALDMCLDMAADACEECACNNCLPEVMACQADPGCVEIRMCAQEAGCTGIGCLGPCGDVINANGGPLGPSAGLASALSDCYEGACANC